MTSLESTQGSAAYHLSQLLGTWHLSTFEGHRADGKVYYPFGPEVVGMLMYDALGHVMVVLMRPDRPKFASNDLRGGTDQEVRTALENFDAYCGTFTLDAERGIVTHHLIASRMPNWVGSDQVRYFKLSNEELRLSTPPIMVWGEEVIFHLLWKRAS